MCIKTAKKYRKYLFCCIFMNIIEKGSQFSFAPSLRYHKRATTTTDVNEKVIEKCFEGLGCVRLTPEWSHTRYRPINVLPSDRHAVNTIFIQWTADKQGNITSEIAKDFADMSKGLKLLIHDFTSNGYAGWIQHLARTFLLNPFNPESPRIAVVSVNWAAGAEPPFVQAVANARLVALEITHFLHQLKSHYNCLPSHVHIIGHGLGAHIAGYVGKMDHLAKITALDPTGPYFMNMPPHVRLHKDDANFVEVVHTDIMPHGQGYPSLLGHVDFYPNAGKRQPGCVDSPLKLTAVKRDHLKLGETLSACSHKRSVKYYIEALIHPTCSMMGVACTSYKDFIRGKCTSCGESMQYCTALATEPLRRNINNSLGFHFITTNSAPYCTEVLKVLLVLKSLTADKNYVKGVFNLTVPQPVGQVNFLLNENHAFSALNTNDHHVFIVFRTVPPPLLMPCKAIHIKWVPNRAIAPLRPKHSIMITGIMIYKMSDDRNTRVQWFCPINQSPNEPWLEPCEKSVIDYEIENSSLVVSLSSNTWVDSSTDDHNIVLSLL